MHIERRLKETPWVVSDQQFIETFPDIDPQKVSLRPLGQGFHHTVYPYGDDGVIKVPRRRYGGALRPWDRMANDVATIKRAFPQYIVPTDVHKSPGHTSYCIEQKKLTYLAYITPELFCAMNGDFRTMIATNQLLIENWGKSLDFLGRDGAKACLIAFLRHKRKYANLTNIVADFSGEQPRLTIIDTYLLHVATPVQRGNQQASQRQDLHRLVYGANRFGIYTCFDYDIGSLPRKLELG